MSGLQRLTLGNTTHAVAAKAAGPVLMVKHFLSLPT
jgi:nucleotide-binding universal stress UspA family protein